MIPFLIASLLLSNVQIKTVATKKTEEAPLQSKFLSGANSLGPETYDELSSTGVLKLNRTNVTNILHVDGSLLAQGARIGSLEVFGEANLNGSTITNSSIIIGYLRAQSTTFLAPLILGAQKAVFTNARLSSLTIRKEDAFKGKQIIELKQGTIVDGPITFESGKGEVHLYSSSKILGPLTGGKCIKK